MANIIKSVIGLGLLAVLSACAQPAEDDYIVVEPEPISVEPVYTGKYK
ncbi:MAG: hypothetical protein R3256_01940 [Thalassovita sp.]|nr:hypothetical protein [Thalassovita sp.]